MKIFRYGIVILMTCVGAIGCGSFTGPTTAPPRVFSEDDPDYRAIMALPDTSDSKYYRLGRFITSYVGDARASSADQCRVIPYGSKPCGGPWTYLVYSTENVDPTVLAELVETYNHLEELYNQRHGMGSDCSEPIQPPVVRQNGRCVAAEE